MTPAGHRPPEPGDDPTGDRNGDTPDASSAATTDGTRPGDTTLAGLERLARQRDDEVAGFAEVIVGLRRDDRPPAFDRDELWQRVLAQLDAGADEERSERAGSPADDTPEES